MVFEEAITNLVNRIIGDYFENVDITQLKLGIWSGKVELENLKLRENVFDEINQPLQLVYSNVGQFRLEIPWKFLYSKPLVAQINDVYILIAPITPQPYDEAREEEFEQAAKQAALQKIDEASKLEFVIDKSKADPSFVEKLTARLINNLQVNITNIHIRYEDTTTNKPFSFGITIHECETYTTDEQWMKSYVSDQVGPIYKIANLNSLAAYMNCNSELYSMFSRDEFENLFKNSIATKELLPTDYHYVLGPISANCMLRLNANPENDDPPFKIPKIYMALEMEKLDISFTSTQFKAYLEECNILQLYEAMNQMKLRAPYRKYRPFNLPYKNHYKEWWHFAITAVLEVDVKMKNKEWSWKHIREHRRLCAFYAKNIKARELAKQPTKTLQEAIIMTETILDVLNIILVRQRVEIELDKIKKRRAALTPGWWGKLFDETEVDTENDKMQEHELTLEEKDTLYKAIGYQENVAPLNLPENYEATDMNFKLVALEIGLYDDTKELSGTPKALTTIMLLKFSVLTSNLRKRPAAKASSVTVVIREITLTGLAENKQSPPIIIESKVLHDDNLLYLFFETNPLERKCHKHIILNVRPMQIVYDLNSVHYLVNAFLPPKSNSLAELENAAALKLAQLKKRSTSRLQYMIDTHHVIESNILIMPFILIIPNDGIYKVNDSAMIVITLGELQCISKAHEEVPQKKVPREQEAKEQEQREKKWQEQQEQEQQEQEQQEQDQQEQEQQEQEQERQEQEQQEQEQQEQELLKEYTFNETVKPKEQLFLSIKEKAYDKYILSLNGAQILVVKPQENWQDILQTHQESVIKILYPISLTLKIELCVIDDDPRFPKTKVNIALPYLNITATEARIFEALDILSSISEKENQHASKFMSSNSKSTADAPKTTLDKNNIGLVANELEHELIQYTDLEMEFSLTEFNVTLLQPCDENCLHADRGSLLENGSSVDEIFIDAKSQLSLDDNRREPHHKKLLTLRIVELKAYVAKRTFEQILMAKLGAINFTQYDYPLEVETLVHIIDTPRVTEKLELQDHLLTIDITMANSKSPEFATKYNSTELLTVVYFYNLNFTAHLEYLSRLMELKKKIQYRLKNFNKSVITNVPTLKEAEDMVVALLHQEKFKASPKEEVINNHIIANLEQVVLKLTCNKRPLASLKIQDLSAAVIVKPSLTEIDLTLKKIIVRDPNPQSIHKNIISILGHDAFKGKLVMHNLHTEFSNSLDDIEIDLEIGCLIFVWMGWFFEGISDFLNHFDAARKALATASAAAADAFVNNALEAFEKELRIKIDIRINAPIIIAPLDSKSKNALVLNLGYLRLSNVTSEVEVAETEHKRHRKALTDELIIELKDFKLARCVLRTNMDSTKKTFENIVTSSDLIYDIKSDTYLLEPISFTLIAQRNLSFEWYRALPATNISVRIKSMNLLPDDYALLMGVLNRNFKEGLVEFPAAKKLSKYKDFTANYVKRLSTGIKDQMLRRKSTDPGENYGKHSIAYRHNIIFDGVVLNLMLDVDDGLGRFGLYFLWMENTVFIDDSKTTSYVLCNMKIDDTRKNNNSQITQYLGRLRLMPVGATTELSTQEVIEACQADRSNLFNMTTTKKGNEVHTEYILIRFELIICIEFFMLLSKFFELPDWAQPDEISKTIESHLSSINRKAASAYITEKENENVTIVLHLEEPDIILTESLEDINTIAIVFNAQAHLYCTILKGRILVNGQIDNIQIYMCNFIPELREESKHYIIQPFYIILQCSPYEKESTHLNLQLTDLKINISPTILEIFNTLLEAFEKNHVKKVPAQTGEEGYTKLWKPKMFKKNDYWFLKNLEDDTKTILSMVESERSIQKKEYQTEKCIIGIPCIRVILEDGAGYYTTPRLWFETKVNAIAYDWSSELKIDGSLWLFMNYYNQVKGDWEPVIEMNEHIDIDGIKTFSPWELKFNLEKEWKESDIEHSAKEQQTKIKIESEKMLELTITKTSLDMMDILSSTFSQVTKSSRKPLVKPLVIAPYVVKNYTGMEISINFTSGVFRLHDSHIFYKVTSTNSLINRNLIFGNDLTESELMSESVKQVTVLAGGRAYLKKVIKEGEKNNLIYIKVGGSKFDKEIAISTTKSDRRYFPIHNDSNPWAIISEVQSAFGSTRVIIHGVVNVSNHFTKNIYVYRQRPQSKEKMLLVALKPGALYHIPLNTIYAENSQLFFGLNGYKISELGVQWNDSLSDTTYFCQVVCNPIDTFEPLYINAVRLKTEIFFENSNKTQIDSAYYTISVRPPLYLKNSLPITISVSVAGCSVRKDEEHHHAKQYLPKSLIKEDLLDYGEKHIDPGYVLQLPTFKMRSGNVTNRSFLVVRLIEYLEKDWSFTTEISAAFRGTGIWTFSSFDSEIRMDLDLYTLFENRNNSLMLTIFSPFWMVNKTGLMLSYKTDTEEEYALYHPPEYTGPVFLAFSERLYYDKKRAAIRVDIGEWSEWIPLDVAGSIGAVNCKANDITYTIGVHNHLTYNSLTKTITFIPFYIITSKCKFRIEIQELSRPDDPWLKIEPNSCKSFWPKNSSDQMCVVRVQGECTNAFDYSEVQCILLKLQNSRHGGINVDVQTTEGGIYIHFVEYQPGDAPGLLINYTSEMVSYYEQGSEELVYTLSPFESIMFAWHGPLQEKMLIFGKRGESTDLRGDDYGQMILSSGSKVYWVTFLDGLQRVLLFTESYDIANNSSTSLTVQSLTNSIEVHIHGIGLSVVNDITALDVLYLCIKGTGLVWEYVQDNYLNFQVMSAPETKAIEQQYQQYLQDVINNTVKPSYIYEGTSSVNFTNMTMIKTVKRQIRRSNYPGVWFSKKSSPYYIELRSKINRIQIDNQLNDCIFPVVLAPVPPPRSVMATNTLKPFMEIRILERILPNTTVRQYKDVTLLIQEFHIKVDGFLLTHIDDILDYRTNDIQDARQFNEDVLYIEQPLADLVEIHYMQEQINFYENFHLGPLKIHISFSMAGMGYGDLPSPLSVLVQGVGVTLTDFNDVVFRLAYFNRDCQFLTQSQLKMEIVEHYAGIALKQLYALVLGLDVLGNPYGLVIGIHKGVKDLFYEPYKGVIYGDFKKGLKLGVKSLVGQTGGGTVGAVSKITGAVAKALAVLTFDEEFQRKRRNSMARRPTNFHQGIIQGGKFLVMGIVYGVAGVVCQPFIGARNAGVGGFIKGFAKGAIGLVTRPATGIVDFTSSSLQAIKNASTSYEQVHSMRLPRFLHHGKLLRPYSHDDALGSKMLKKFGTGKYAKTDIFEHAVEIVSNREILIATDKRIIYASKKNFLGIWAVRWAYLWLEVEDIVSNNELGKLEIKCYQNIRIKHIRIEETPRREHLAETLNLIRSEALTS